MKLNLWLRRLRSNAYLRALEYFREDSWSIALLIFLIGLSTALGLMAAWPMAVLVDSILTATPQTRGIHKFFLALTPDSKVYQIVILAVLSLGLKLGQEGLKVGQSMLQTQINFRGLRRIRCDLYKKLQSLNLAYHRSQPVGDSIYRLTSDTFGGQAVLGVAISTVVAVVTLVAIIGLLLSRHVTLTILALSVVPPLVLANFWFEKTLRKKSLETKERDTEFLTTVHQSISSIDLVQAFCRERYEFERFDQSYTDSVRAWWRLNNENVLYWLCVGTIFGVGASIVFGYGGYLVYQNQFVQPQPDGMTVGDLIIFSAYLGMLWDPLCKLTGASANMQGGMAGVQRVFDVLDEKIVIQSPVNGVRLPLEPRPLRFESVSFGYKKNQEVIKDLNFEIQPGELIAFVGPSGVGKSTILNLLPRFYDVTSGRILIGNTDIKNIQLEDLRRHIAIVLQDSILLPTSIAENIAYGRPEASFEEIRRAAEDAGAAEFIEKLPDSYRTLVSEGGKNLSGGQRQRISIARALLTGAPVVVLDEPTSALDPEHEQKITELLNQIKGSRTLVLVTHRMQSTKYCDRIFVMKDGKVQESGAPSSLLQENGLYAKMWRQQAVESSKVEQVTYKGYFVTEI